MNEARIKVTTALAWAWVSVPFAYGLYELILKAANLFGS
ncbi:MFS transporter small subunit [Rhodococcus sp. 077-4]